MKVVDIELATLAPESCANRTPTIRENSTSLIARNRALLFDDRARIVARDVEKRNALVVASLLSGVFAIPYKEHFRTWIKIRPFDPADLILAHCRRHRKANDPSDWNLLSGIRIESNDRLVDFSRCWTSIALFSFPDEAKSRQSYARQRDRFRGQDNAMYGYSVR